MKISVIISAYNRAGYLERAVKGYFNQSVLPDEIVVADDGSTEETALLLKQLAKNAPVPLLHVWHEDRGFRAAKIRNTAIARSSGEQLIICDDDIIPSPDLVADHATYAEEGCFVQGHRVLLGPDISRWFTFNDGAPLKLLRFFFKGEVKNLSNAFHLPRPLIRLSQDMGGIRSCNMSFSRKSFLAVNGFNEDFEGWGREDSELVVRFYKYGLKRKDIKFRACCYHLYHGPYSRENLDRNDTLIKETVGRNGYYCANGIDKYLMPLP
jgi:glycosyltransferase involved in cell wall biosynthesis